MEQKSKNVNQLPKYLTMVNLKLLLLVILSNVLISCSNNGFYFDLKEQKIISCSTKGIDYLHLESKKPFDYYRIEWQDSIHSSPREINVNNIPPGYRILYGFSDYNTIKPNKFKLLKNAEYELRRSQGDATSATIKIYTDSLGRVNKTNRSECHN